MFRKILLLCAVGVAVETLLGAEAGSLGDPRQLAIQGVESYHADDLRRALRQDWIYQMAARPSAPLEELLPVLENRLTVGYRRGGFPDAVVTAVPDEERRRIDVRVEEGTGYLAGKICILGASPAVEREITARLRGHRDGDSLRKRVRLLSGASYRRPRNGTQPNADEPAVFRPGEAVSFITDPISGYRDQIADALADLGYFQPKFDVVLDYDTVGGTANLVVTLHDPGPLATVERVRVLGLHINDEQDVLDLLAIPPQARLDQELLEAVEQKLRHCGRFWSYSVELSRQPTADHPKASLQIGIAECPGLPPIDEPLPPALEAARRLGLWLDGLSSASGDLVIDVESHDAARDNARLAASVAISRQDGLALDIRGRGDGAWRINHALIVSNERLGLYAHDRSARFDVNPQGRLQCQLEGEWMAGDLAADKTFALSLVLTFNSREESRWSVAVHPVVFVRMAQQADREVRIADGQMTLAWEDIRITADADTGRLARWQMLQDGGATVEVQLHVHPGAVLERTNALDRASPSFHGGGDQVDSHHSFVSFALGEIVHQAQLTRSAESARTIRSLGEDLEVRCRAWRESVRTTATAPPVDPHRPRFTIRPVDRGLDLMTQLPRFGLSAADELFPHGGEAWTLLRECCFALVNRGGPPQWEELRRLINSGEIGPIGCVLAVEFFCSESNTPAVHMARLGLARMDEERVRQEFRAVLLETERTKQIVNTAGEVVRWIPRDLWQEALPHMPPSTAAVLDKWSHELDRAPDAEPAILLVEALVREWDERLETIVRTRLERYANASESTANHR